MAHPRFLKAFTSSAPRRYLDKTARSYRPMLGIWLIDLALILEWYRPKRPGRWPGIFTDYDFCLLTGLQNPDELALETDADDEDVDLSPKCPAAGGCRQLLLRQRSMLQGEKLSKALPLFTNVSLLSTILGLTDADQALLTFAAALQVFPSFNKAISPQNATVSNQALYQILERLTGVPANEFTASLGEEGVLVATGIVRPTLRNGELLLVWITTPP